MHHKTLIKQVLNGREDARRAFVKRWAPVVHGWVLARVGTVVETEDLTNRVLRRFLVECTHLLVEFDVPVALRNLVQEVLTEHLHALGKGHVPTAELDEKLQPWTASSDVRAQKAVRRLDAEAVSRGMRCLQQLSMVQREALILHHSEGLRPADLAETLETSVDDVFKHLTRAHALYAERLAVARNLDGGL